MVLSAVSRLRHRVVRIDVDRDLVDAGRGDEIAPIDVPGSPGVAGAQRQVVAVLGEAIDREGDAVRGTARQVLSGVITSIYTNWPGLMVDSGLPLPSTTRAFVTVMLPVGARRSSSCSNRGKSERRNDRRLERATRCFCTACRSLRNQCENICRALWQCRKAICSRHLPSNESHRRFQLHEPLGCDPDGLQPPTQDSSARLWRRSRKNSRFLRRLAGLRPASVAPRNWWSDANRTRYHLLSPTGKRPILNAVWKCG